VFFSSGPVCLMCWVAIGASSLGIPSVAMASEGLYSLAALASLWSLGFEIALKDLFSDLVSGYLLIPG